jgi:hypothetical protein
VDQGSTLLFVQEGSNKKSPDDTMKDIRGHGRPMAGLHSLGWMVDVETFWGGGEGRTMDGRGTGANVPWRRRRRIEVKAGPDVFKQEEPE